MKFSFEYNRKESGIPIMSIEQDNHIYQLYIGTDCHVHLVEDSSKEFTSSSNLESCLNCSILSKKTRAFYQSIIIYGSFYEVLQKAGICKDFDIITMKILTIFIYHSLDYLGIKYDCQYEYTQLKSRIFSQMQRTNNTSVCNTKGDLFCLSIEKQCFYLKLTSNDKREFYYGKCIDKNNECSFIYNLICVLLHFCYPSKELHIPYEYFLDVMNQPDEYPYPDELKNKIMEAFGNTKEIQNAFLLHPQELFDFLYHRFNSSLLSKEQVISRLNSISLQSNILQELYLLIQES